MRREIAQMVLTQIKASIQQLEDSLVIVQDNCDADELMAFKYGIGFTLSEIHDRILDPLIREHPDLLPEGVDYEPPSGPTLAQMAARYNDERSP